MYSEQNRVRLLRGVSRRSGPRLTLGVHREPPELLLAAGVAKDHFVSGAGEKRPEFAAH
jgi:hypothetical protein